MAEPLIPPLTEAEADPERSARPTLEAEFPLHLSGILSTDTDQLPARPKPPPGMTTVRPLVPGYEILKELGRGGMGVVFLARQTPLNRLVALKMILDGAFASVEDRQRFLREAEMIAKLQHPHIVQVYEFGACDGHPYFSLEYIPGGTLAEVLQGKPQDPRPAATLIAQLADAVDHAHQHGIVHRDLKPANVLLQMPNEECRTKNDKPHALPFDIRHSTFGIPKIADFGLAKQVQGEGLTASGTLLGTPSYMAPEQAGGRGSVGPAADVYALGAILYELLTGRPPFQGLNAMDTAMQVIAQEPVPPRRLVPSVPRDLETIALKCLAKESSRRYPTAAALAEDARRYLENQPIQARPVGPLFRLVKWARRRPGIACMSVAMLLLAAISFAGLSWLYWNAEEQRLQAEAARLEARAAEAKAKQSEAAAIQAAARAEAINRFFLDHFLTQIRPERAQNRTITFEEVLSRAAARLSQVFAGQPELEWQMRSVIGRVYVELGRRADALPHLERAVELSRQLHGPDDNRTLVARTNLANLHAQMGATPRNIQELRGLLAQRLKEHGPDHLESIAVKNSLAQALLPSNPREAESLYRDALQRAQATLGTEHGTTCMVQANLGFLLHRQDQQTEAEALLRQATQGLRRQLGQEHPTTITSESNWAMTLTALGRHEEAEKLFRHVLEVRTRILGPTHPDTLTAQHNIGSTLYAQRRFPEAQAVFQSVLAARQEHAGPEHPDTLATLDQLAQAVFAQKKHDEAIVLLRDLLDRYRRVHGTSHPQTQRTLSNLASEMGNAHRFVEAEPLFSELHAQRVEKFGVEHPETLKVLFLQAYCRLQAGALSQAEPLLRTCVTLRRKVLGPAHADTQQAVVQLVRCLASQRQTAEAETLLLETRQAVETDARTSPAQRRALLEMLIQFYTETGQPEKANQWKRKRTDA